MSKQGQEEQGNDEDLVNDPLVQKTIDQALAPYVGLAPPALLRTMREALEEDLTTEAYSLGLIHALRARPTNLSTVEGLRKGASPSGSVHAAAAQRRIGRGGREGA